jgi:hypothetical protein
MASGQLQACSLPLNRDTPRMEKMSQNMDTSMATLPIPGRALTNAVTTTWPATVQEESRWPPACDGHQWARAVGKGPPSHTWIFLERTMTRKGRMALKARKMDTWGNARAMRDTVTTNPSRQFHLDLK